MVAVRVIVAVAVEVDTSVAVRVAEGSGVRLGLAVGLASNASMAPGTLQAAAASREAASRTRIPSLRSSFEIDMLACASSELRGIVCTQAIRRQLDLGHACEGTDPSLLSRIAGRAGQRRPSSGPGERIRPASTPPWPLTRLGHSPPTGAGIRAGSDPPHDHPGRQLGVPRMNGVLLLSRPGILSQPWTWRARGLVDQAAPREPG